MRAFPIITDGSVDQTDITLPQIDTCGVSLQKTLHEVTQRCQKVRDEAKPFYQRLLEYRFPGGRVSEGGYYHLPEDLSFCPCLNQKMFFKMSLDRGLLFASEKGRNFTALRFGNGRFYDILDLWLAREGEGTTVLEACKQLSEDIRWVKMETPAQREEREAEQKRLDTLALQRLYSEIRYNMSSWMRDDAVGMEYQAIFSKFWKVYSEEFGYPLSRYQFRDMLLAWAENQSDVWFTVEEVILRKSYREFRLVKTAVTDETVKERRQAEKERLKAEKKAEKERQWAEIRVEDEARQRKIQRECEEQDRKQKEAQKKATDHVESLRAQYKELKAQIDAALKGGVYLIEVSKEMDKIGSQMMSLHKATYGPNASYYQWRNQ